MFTKNIKNSVLLTKSGVRWLNSSLSNGFVEATLPSTELNISDFKGKNANQQDELLKNATPQQRAVLLGKILKLTGGTQENIKWREGIRAKILNLNIAYAPLTPSTIAQQTGASINTPSGEALVASQTAENKEITQEQEKTQETIVTSTRVEAGNLKKEVIYDQPLVRNYAQKINLGSAIAFVNQQNGNKKIQSAIDALKTSKIINSAQSPENPKALPNYTFREELADMRIQNPDRNAKRAIEADHLLGFLEGLQKLDDSKRKVILDSRLVSDEKVKSGELPDLIADFDDDGILESINGTDTTTWWKWLVTKFGAGDAMQTQFFRESDMKQFLVKNMPEIRKYFEGIGIRQGEGEKQEDYAKRLRNAITIQADMLKTGYIGENGMKNIYSSAENHAERQTIEKVLTEVKNALGKDKNITPADLQKVSEKVTDMIVRTVITLGGGSINLQEISKLVSDPKNTGVIGMDYSAFLRLINSPRLKVDGSAGVSAGVVDGRFIPLAHIGAGAKVTVVDRADIVDLMKNIDNGNANVTAKLGASLVTKLSGPAINVDLLWKDRIDQMENAGLHLRAVIDEMMTIAPDGTPSLDTSKIDGKKMDQSLRDFISLLKSAITEGAKNLTKPEEKQAHAVLMKNRFLNAFDLYLHNHPNLKGVGLAGITLGFMPGAIGVGPVFQNVAVDRKARKLDNTPAASSSSMAQSDSTKTESLKPQSGMIEKNKQELIQKLDIDRLFNNPNVTKFLVFMTNNGGSPNYEKAFAAAMKVQEFKSILGKDTKYSPNMNTLLDEIDEKFVGDQITRGYNRAKSNDKAFQAYINLLKSKKVAVPSFITRQNMTPALIADVSFNKPKVRKDELKLLKEATGIDTSAIDTELINGIKNETGLLSTQGSPALVLMARSRQLKGLQGVRAYTTGSYIREKLIPDTTPAQKLATLEKALGGKAELEKLVTETLVKSEIILQDGQSIQFDRTRGTATVQTKENGKITIDLSATQLSAVLYGDTTMDKNKAQAVCVNAGIKIDPKITIKSEGSQQAPLDPVTGAGERVSDIGFNGTPVNSTLNLVVTATQGDGVGSGRDPGGSSGDVSDGIKTPDSNAGSV